MTSAMFVRRRIVSTGLASAAFAALVLSAQTGRAQDLVPPSDAPAVKAPIPLSEVMDARRREADAREAEAKARAADARKKAAEAKRKADIAHRNALQMRADEADMLGRARAEAEERAAERRRLEAEVEKTEAERSAAAARLARQSLETNRTAAEREADEDRLIEAATAADAARRAMEEEREAEAARLAEKIRQAQERRAAKAAGAAEPAQPGALASEPDKDTLPPPMPSTAEGSAPSQRFAPSPSQARLPQDLPAASVTADTHVTILIVLEPGNRGIRRYEKTADPVLCLRDACYISEGAEREARRVSRWQALGSGNTLGGRAGACNHSLGCVFRNVDLGTAHAILQPIDLRIMRHDRREARGVSADPTCEVLASRLSCSAGISANDYRVWVVPERVARKAGASALQTAVDGGLPDGRRVELGR